MNTVETTVRGLAVGDIVLPTRVTVLALGAVHEDPDWQRDRRRGPRQRAIRVIDRNGRVTVRTWRANTRMRVERTEGCACGHQHP